MKSGAWSVESEQWRVRSKEWRVNSENERRVQSRERRVQSGIQTSRVCRFNVLVAERPHLNGTHNTCTHNNSLECAARELSIGLCKGNAVLYKRGLYAFARASGVLIQPGADQPTVDVS